MDRYESFAYPSCVMISAILYTLSYRRPPPPKGSQAYADSVTSSPLIVAATASAWIFPLAPAIGVITLVASGWSFADPIPSNLCPRPTNVSPIFVTFNRTTTIVLICTFCGSLLRYVAMVQLGRSFTWELARPAGGFKQDGLYRYMQHPSYTGAFLANVTYLTFFWRFDGPLACWVPAWMGRSQLLNGILLLLVMFLQLWSLWKRIPEEEAMMKKEFGKQWVEYHRLTKRFIPGLF